MLMHLGRRPWLLSAAVVVWLCSAHFLYYTLPNLDSNEDWSAPLPLFLHRAGFWLMNVLPRLYSHVAPPHMYALQLSSCFIYSKALFTATRLGVAGRLWDPTAQRPRELDIRQLADEVGADAERLHRVMRALAGIGVFSQLGPGRFTNNAVSGVLRVDHPNSLHHAVLVAGGTTYSGQEMMYQSVLKGAGATALELRNGGVPLFTYLQQPGNEGLQEVFDRAMLEGGEVLSTRFLLSDYRWAAHQGATLVDVGGGIGGFLARLLEAQPGITGVLFDSAPVVARAERLWQECHAGVLGRAAFRAGSFFEAIPPGDVFFLRHILHDWNDTNAQTILKAVHRACNGRDAVLLIAETVMPEEDEGALVGAVQAVLDLQMMGTVGGKERSRSEFALLLSSAGFRLHRVWEIRGVLSMLEARVDLV